MEKERKVQEQTEKARRARRRTQMALLVSLLAILLAGFAGWQYLNAQKQKALAENNAARADSLANVAQTLAQEALDSAAAAKDQRIIALAAQDTAEIARGQAEASAARASQALKNLAINNESFLNGLLEATESNIYQLEYGQALGNLNSALRVAPALGITGKEAEIIRNSVELTFFYNEAGQLATAVDLLKRTTEQLRDTSWIKVFKTRLETTIKALADLGPKDIKPNLVLGENGFEARDSSQVKWLYLRNLVENEALDEVIRNLTDFVRKPELEGIDDEVTLNFVQWLLSAVLQTLAPAQYQTLKARYYPKMIEVPGGSFQMGRDTSKEESVDEDELPQHEVELPTFRLAKTETTFWQFSLFAQATGRAIPPAPSWGKNGDHPVVNVNWYDAVEYANWLSGQWGLEAVYTIDKTKKDTIYNLSEYDDLKWLVIADPAANGFRLPTEAEWEYAARGGSDWEDGFIFAGSDDLDSVGWYGSNSDGRTQVVGTKTPNQLGLYDMSGNVWEWCWDWYDAEYYQQLVEKKAIDPKGPDRGSGRVLRGGSWDVVEDYCRSTLRLGNDPNDEYDSLGFRLARD